METASHNAPGPYSAHLGCGPCLVSLHLFCQRCFPHFPCHFTSTWSPLAASTESRIQSVLPGKISCFWVTLQHALYTLLGIHKTTIKYINMDLVKLNLHKFIETNIANLKANKDNCSKTFFKIVFVILQIFGGCTPLSYCADVDRQVLLTFRE